MAQKGDENFNKDVEKAVKAGSDFSQGGEHAYKALMSELAQDQQKYANDPAKFDQLGKAVAANLDKTGHADETMVRWMRDNMNRFDTSGNHEVDKQETNPRNPTAVSGFEKAMLTRFQSKYESLNNSDTLNSIFRSSDDSFSKRDFEKVIAAYEKPVTEGHEAAQRQELAQRQLDQKNNVVHSLMKNDGNPANSLAAVLDIQRGVNPDGEISRRDIRKFVDNFDQGQARGDFGYTQANLDAAKLLDSQWNAPLGVSLRGQYERNNGGGHGGSQDMVTHDRIDLKRMAELQGTTLDQLYAANVSKDARPVRHAANTDDRTVRPVSADDQSVAAAPGDARQPAARRVEQSEDEQRQDLAQRQGDQKGYVMDALLKNNGDPRTSLAAVLDVQRGVNPDGEISRRDIRKFIDNYDGGQSRGDLGYNQANLDAAKLLDSQWNAPLGVSLRGQYDANRGGHGGGTDKVTHDRIDLKRLAEMNGTTVDQMYASHARPDAGHRRTAVHHKDTGVKAVSADGQAIADYPTEDQVPVPTERPDPKKATDGAVPITDLNALDDKNAAAPAAAARVAETKDDGRPTTRTLKESARVDERVAAPAEKVAPEKLERPASKEVAPAAKPFEAPKPIPELVIPEIKLDGDMVKARADLAKNAAEHFQARAIYTVRPGQGWDRIARDVLRQEKDGSHTNEGLVVALSDHVAKGNGWEGRLDPTKMLHPGDQVRVMTDEAVKARTEEILKQFDAKVAEMQKAAAPKTTDNGDPALFDGKRSGETDVVDPAKAAKVEPAKEDPSLFDGKRSGETDTKAGDPKVVPAPVETVIDPAKDPAKAPPAEVIVPAADPAKADPQLKASNDNGAGTATKVVATDVASPGEDFAVSAVSAANAETARDQKAETEHRIAQEAKRKRDLAKSNAMEGFETPKIG
ncbi:hypothetical protein BH11CYA1_BH11CYA1_30410 [soil metagenome]